MTGLQIARQFAAIDRVGSAAIFGRRSQASRTDAGCRTGSARRGTDTEHMEAANELSESQDEFRVRLDKVVERIKELPDAEADFGKEIALLDPSLRRDGRNGRDPGQSRNRTAGDRRRNRDHRVAVAVQTL